jgi:hypothetical protein
MRDQQVHFTLFERQNSQIRALDWNAVFECRLHDRLSYLLNSVLGSKFSMDLGLHHDSCPFTSIIILMLPFLHFFIS